MIIILKRNVKPLLVATGIIFFIAAVIYLIIFNFYFNYKFVALCCIACVLILCGLFFEDIVKRRWLKYSIVSLCVCLVIMMLFLGIYGNVDNVTYNEDAVIVLGAGIKGEYVTELLAYRLLNAIEFSRINPNAVIIVSGGQGPDEDITEALAMERYLVMRGVPPEKIIREEASKSTYENLLYSKEILDNLFNGPYKVTIITNDFHIFRAVGIAGKLGLAATHFHANTKWYSVPFNYSRECLAVFKFWVFGK